MTSETQRRLYFARALRNNPTPAEEMLWQALSRLRPRFTRQLRLDPFVTDFACRRARLIVEADGSQHAESKADDARTALLEAEGWRVIRFWNSEITDNVDGVVEAIIAAVAARIPVGEEVHFIASRAGRERRPRGREKEPPPTPPARAGGES
jgi:primosomal protein N' (replication factor Y)